MGLIQQHINVLRKLCEQYHVLELYVFGSEANGKATAHSDIDLLVEFSNVEPLEHFDNYMDFKTELTQLFSRKIDLVEVQTIHNPILKKSIERDKVKLYGREDTKVAL